MTADDLSTPLGQKLARKRRFRLPFTMTQAIVTVLGLVLTAFFGFAIFNDSPLGGEPVAHIALRSAAAPSRRTGGIIGSNRKVHKLPQVLRRLPSEGGSHCAHVGVLVRGPDHAARRDSVPEERQR